VKTFIIAEAGVNHNGSLNIAKKLINEAKAAGANAVKFQTFKAEEIVSRFAPKAKYQKKTTDKKESQLEMLRKLELSDIEHAELIKHCRKKGIVFLSTPFDLGSIDLLKHFHLAIFKIPSGDITNLPYLRKIGALKKKVILSTGMANLKEVESALDVLIEGGTRRRDVTMLHATTEYPTPYEDVNLRAMLTIKEAFNVKIGYSDHTIGIEVPIAAVALGATVIEKHFTLDKNMRGPDHRASLEPHELRAMIMAIRNIEKALGSGIKKPASSEIKNIAIARKSIVASKTIAKGELLTEQNVTVKRPGTGISPMLWDKLLGKRAKKNFREDELIDI